MGGFILFEWSVCDGWSGWSYLPEGSVWTRVPKRGGGGVVALYGGVDVAERGSKAHGSKSKYLPRNSTGDPSTAQYRSVAAYRFWRDFNGGKDPPGRMTGKNAGHGMASAFNRPRFGREAWLRVGDPVCCAGRLERNPGEGGGFRLVPVGGAELLGGTEFGGFICSRPDWCKALQTVEKEGGSGGPETCRIVEMA